MKVGIIAPISLLSKYCITPIQYCLPRLLVENKEYREFYLERKVKGNFIILDCKKLGWKRKPEDFKVIGKALTFFHPDTIVLPSVMYNWEGTIEIVNRFFKEFNKIFTYAICLEGTSYEEVGKCLAELRKISPLVAIPSHIYKLWKGEEWEGNVIYIENHLNLDELDGLDGCLVTSLPVRLGLEGRLLSDYLPSPPSLTFYEEEDNYPMITKKNVEEALEHYKT